jgi:hypothetical protein
MAFAAHLTSPAFKENAKSALADRQLQSALHGIETGIVDRRRAVVARLPEFEALRDSARAIKNHTLAHLDLYLEQFEQRCTAAGGHVHYAVTAEEARTLVLDICRKANAKLVTKGKSMIGEEIAINDFLEQNGIAPVETDLGEYLVQIRRRAALAHHHAGGAPHQGADRGRLPPRAHASAGRPQSRGAPDAAHRGACDPARSLSSRPMSASPARTSWWPRPARRSS